MQGIYLVELRGIIRAGDKLTVGPDGRVQRAAGRTNFPIGVALDDSFPEGCLGIWDERRCTGLTGWTGYNDGPLGSKGLTGSTGVPEGCLWIGEERLWMPVTWKGWWVQLVFRAHVVLRGRRGRLDGRMAASEFGKKGARDGYKTESC